MEQLAHARVPSMGRPYLRRLSPVLMGFRSQMRTILTWVYAVLPVTMAIAPRLRAWWFERPSQSQELSLKSRYSIIWRRGGGIGLGTDEFSKYFSCRFLAWLYTSNESMIYLTNVLY
jgi:hypothetical protein